MLTCSDNLSINDYIQGFVVVVVVDSSDNLSINDYIQANQEDKINSLRCDNLSINDYIQDAIRSIIILHVVITFRLMTIYRVPSCEAFV